MSFVNLGKKNLSDQQASNLVNDLLTPVFHRFEDEIDAGRITYADYDKVLDCIHVRLNSKHSDLVDTVL